MPSRLQPGRFYALPQSPQILKQLTMVAGFDRYYQIAICFRDEDLRADRVQEITQLDVEMASPTEELLFALMERDVLARSGASRSGSRSRRPLPRMTYAGGRPALRLDKPDLRFGLELEDATDVDARLGVRRLRGRRGRQLPPRPAGVLARRAAALEEFAKEWGAKGLAYLVDDEEGEVRSPIAKFLSEAELAALRGDPGDDAALRRRHWPTTSRVLGALRTHLGERARADRRVRFTFLWVTDFPMFEWDEDERRWTAVHHPFTRPAPMGGALRRRPGDALAHAYDLIVQRQRAGRRLVPDPRARAPGEGLRPARARRRRAAGEVRLPARRARDGRAAARRDRARHRPMTMVLAGEPNLRDVIAFPKNQAGLDPMSGAPSEVTAAQLDELGLTVVVREADLLSARVVQRLLSLAAIALLAGVVAVAVVDRREETPVASPQGASRPGAAGTTRSPRPRPPGEDAERTGCGLSSRALPRRLASRAALRREDPPPLRRRDGPHRGDRQPAEGDGQAVRADAVPRPARRARRHPGDRVAVRDPVATGEVATTLWVLGAARGLGLST